MFHELYEVLLEPHIVQIKIIQLVSKVVSNCSSVVFFIHNIGIAILIFKILLLHNAFKSSS